MHIVSIHDQQFAAGSFANSNSQMSREICGDDNTDVTRTGNHKRINTSRINDSLNEC